MQDAEDVASGGFRGAVLGQQAGDELVVGERFAEFGLDQSEDQQRDPDDAGQRVDAVVDVQEDRADFAGWLVVAVAALDESAGLCSRVAVARRSASRRGGCSRARRSPSVCPAAAIASWSRVQVSVGLPLRVAVVVLISPSMLGAMILGDAGLDLLAGLVVARRPRERGSCSSGLLSARSRSAAVSRCSSEEWM